jgi:hypothetical protein
MSCIAGERPTSGMFSTSSGLEMSAALAFGSVSARPTIAMSSFRSNGFGRYS